MFIFKKWTVTCVTENGAIICLRNCNAFRFNQQNKEVRFGSYVFGPVVMRMYYFLNKPDEALQVSHKLWTWTCNNNMWEIFNYCRTSSLFLSLTICTQTTILCDGMVIQPWLPASVLIFIQTSINILKQVYFPCLDSCQFTHWSVRNLLNCKVLKYVT
jgi:hypothetical protein